MAEMSDYLSDNYTAIRPIDEQLITDIFAAFLKADCRQDKKISLLEIGCGPGRISTVLTKIPQIKLTCIDIRPELVGLAKKATSHCSDNIEFIIEDFMTHDFKSNKYDYILFSHYLHLQVNAIQHIKKAHGLLTHTTGRLLILF